MVKFDYNNVKYASIRYMTFKLNCRYHPQVSYKEDIDYCSRSRVADELTEKLRNLMVVYRENLQYAQKLQKQAHDKVTKPRSYASSKKVWFNSKYIKIKCNQKLEVKFFGPFQVLHLVGSQAYKLELPK